jgi:hypothetical protein
VDAGQDEFGRVQVGKIGIVDLNPDEEDRQAIRRALRARRETPRYPEAKPRPGPHASLLVVSALALLLALGGGLVYLRIAPTLALPSQMTSMADNGSRILKAPAKAALAAQEKPADAPSRPSPIPVENSAQTSAPDFSLTQASNAAPASESRPPATRQAPGQPSPPVESATEMTHSSSVAANLSRHLPSTPSAAAVIGLPVDVEALGLRVRPGVATTGSVEVVNAVQANPGGFRVGDVILSTCGRSPAREAADAQGADDIISDLRSREARKCFLVSRNEKVIVLDWRNPQ